MSGSLGDEVQSSQDLFQSDDPAKNDEAIGENLRDIMLGAGPPSERHTSVTNNAADDIAPLNDLGDIPEDPGWSNKHLQDCA